MGIRLGYNWCFEISRGIGGPDPYYIVRLRKPEQDRLLEIARSPRFGYGMNNTVPVERSAEQCARDRAIIAVMLFGGLFHDQVASLRTNAITSNSGGHSVSYVGNDGEWRQHPLLSSLAADAVANYISVTSRLADGRDPLFIYSDVEAENRKALDPEYIARILLSLMREVPLHSERASVYVLRNSFAKAWIDAGRNVSELQAILNFKNAKIMDSYLRNLDLQLVNPEEEELVVGDWQTNLLRLRPAVRNSEHPIGCLRRIQGESESHLVGLPCETGDVFLCCVSEDELGVALPLARELLLTGLSVRLSKYSLRADETLDMVLADGFARCSYGLVIISPAFIDAKLSPRELSALFAGVQPGSVIPVWHNVTRDDVEALNSIIARIQATQTKDGLDAVAYTISLSIRLTKARAQRDQRDAT